MRAIPEVAADPLLGVRISDPQVAVSRECLAAFEREFDYLCRTLRRLGTHPVDVEDLAHEVFIVLRRRWSDYDSTRPFRPWLFGIAFRVASAHRKRLAREVPHASVEVEDVAMQPEEVAVAKQSRALVLSALQHVPLSRRVVLILHDIDDVSMRDVAVSLNLPLFTAYSRLRKARLEFKAAVLTIQKRAK